MAYEGDSKFKEINRKVWLKLRQKDARTTLRSSLALHGGRPQEI